MNRKQMCVIAVVVALFAALTSVLSTDAKVDTKVSVESKTPAALTKVIGGVTFTFVSADIISDSVVVGDSFLNYTSGFSVLCVRTSYVGDMSNIYPKSRTKASITIIDKNLVMSALSGAQWSNSKADLCFYVVDDSGPYMLRSTDDPSWFFDLTPLMKK